MSARGISARAATVAAVLVFALLVATRPAQPAVPEQAAESAQAQAEQPGQVEEQLDIVYAVHDGVELLGDLYSPAEGTGPFPAVLMVHGGGWRGGSRASYANLGRYLAQHGYVAFSATYRLAPGEGEEPSLETSTYPQNIWDLKAALQYLRGEAETLRIDPERLAATGNSAGGHLVAMLGLTGGQERFANPYEDEHADQPDNVDVIAPTSGVYYMQEQWERDLQRRPQSPITEWYLGGPFYDGAVRSRYYEASPTYHATTQNAAGTAWMVVWASEDDVVTPEAQALPFIEDLKRTNATVRHLPLIGETHFSTLSDPGGWDIAAPSILAFLDSQLQD